MARTKTARNAKITAFIGQNIRSETVILEASKKFKITTSTVYHICRQNNITLPKVISTRIDPEAHDVHGVHPCLKLGLGFD